MTMYQSTLAGEKISDHLCEDKGCMKSCYLDQVLGNYLRVCRRKRGRDNSFYVLTNSIMNLWVCCDVFE